MRDHAHSRPGSIAGSIISSAITTPATLHSRSTSTSSFTGLSASSTNVYSSHSRRVRSIRKLRQILGPPDDQASGGIERMELAVDKDLPLTPSPSPSISPHHPVPPNNQSAVSLRSSLSDIQSEDEMSEKSISLVYARRVKLEKLKRRLGEDVPKELIFFDQSSPSPASSHKRHSFSSSNVINFTTEYGRFSRGHMKNAASVSTIGTPNGAMIKRSKAILRLWKSKPRSDNTHLSGDGMDGESSGGANAHRAEGVSDSSHTGDETLYPIQVTSLAGSEWSFSKDNDKGSNEGIFDQDTVMHSHFDTIDETPDFKGMQGVKVVRSRNTIIIERTSEDDEREYLTSQVEPLRKSTFFDFVNVNGSPVEQEKQLDSPHSSLGDSHNKSVRPDDSPAVQSLRKTRSAVALASEGRIQATNTETPPFLQIPSPHSARRQDGEFSAPSTSSSILPRSSPPRHQHRHRGHTRRETTTIGSDENLTSEDDRRAGRASRRESKPKGPRPSSRPRPRTADDGVKLRHSNEALEHWQLLERKQKLVPDRPSLESSSSNSLSASTQSSLPGPSTKPPGEHPKPQPLNSSQEALASIPTTIVSSPHKPPQKPMAAVVYFYHRGVVRLAIEEGAKTPKTMQTVHMRDVLNYLREMRYVH